MQKIFVGMPNFDHKVYLETAFNLMELLLEVQKRGDTLSWLAPTSPFITQNRNQIMQKGLDYDWILMLDSDIQVAKNDFIYSMIETAYKYDAVMVGLLVRIKGMPDDTQYACGMAAKDGIGYNRLTQAPLKAKQVDVMGAGVSVIQSRWVRDNLEQPFFEFKDIKNDNGSGILPEDWRFCEKIREKGGIIMVDPTIETIHWGNYGWHYTIK